MKYFSTCPCWVASARTRVVLCLLAAASRSVGETNMDVSDVGSMLERHRCFHVSIQLQLFHSDAKNVEPQVLGTRKTSRPQNDVSDAEFNLNEKSQ